MIAGNDFQAENITFMICITVIVVAFIIAGGVRVVFGRDDCEDDDDVSDSPDTP